MIYSGVVFMNYYYYEVNFYWENFDLFSCTDEKIYLYLYIFVVYFGYLVFLATISNAIVGNSLNIF